jgi:transposase-like protein
MNLLTLAGVSRPSQAIWKAFRGAFQRTVHRRPPAACAGRVLADSWPQFVLFLDYDHEVPKVLYTANIIESLNARFRQAARRRGRFPPEQAAMKVLYPSSNRNARVAGVPPAGSTRPRPSTL